MSLNEIYDKVYDSAFCINPHTKKLYFLFIKNLIQKYLDDTNKNYCIFVSTTAELLPYYKAMWPNSQRIIYTSDDFIPLNVPDTANNIYIYHPKTTPVKEEQLNLLSFMETRPLMKYIYIGVIHKLLTSVRIILFRYYLHFETSTGRYYRLSAGSIIHYNVNRKIRRSYNSQNLKKKKVVNPIFIYDYFVIHDNLTDESNIVKFNQTKFIPKKKKVIASTFNSKKSPGIDGSNVTKIRYIYTTSPNNSTFLTMPDGSKENYSHIVSKYQDVIEV